jgi:hypothetical protein
MKDLDTRTIVNEFGLVIDESYSMTMHARTVVQVVDGLVKHLAQTSKDMEQETRISVYAFNSRGTDRCLVWDTDVLRVPSIDGKYSPGGNTALVDCTCLAIDDLRMIPVKYGERSFWVDAITDGQENNSRQPERLKAILHCLPEEWTVTAHVPDNRGRDFAIRNGFHPDNVQLWDTSGSFEQVGQSLRDSADRFMAGRAQGVRGYSSGGLFRVRDVSARDVTSRLVPLTAGSYQLFHVPADIPISVFVQAQTGRPYAPGKSYYQFTKTETIQGYKQVAFQLGSDVYMGTMDQARQMLGLPEYSVRARPGQADGKVIFVQSTSHNRKLIAGTQLLVLR